jgi:hypothetical protein
MKGKPLHATTALERLYPAPLERVFSELSGETSYFLIVSNGCVVGGAALD